MYLVCPKISWKFLLNIIEARLYNVYNHEKNNEIAFSKNLLTT